MAELNLLINGEIKKIVGAYTLIGGEVKQLLWERAVGEQIEDFIRYTITLTDKITFDESMNRTMTKIITIPDLVSVDEISTNTGNVEYSITGNEITITVTNGDIARSEYNAHKYSKTATAYRTSSSNSFSSTYSYSSGGYLGTLRKSGSSYVYSGSYTPSSSKTVSHTISSSVHYADSPPSFPSSYSYNSGGYAGIIPFKTLTTIGSYWAGFYQGTVTKPSSDTRRWKQNYSGTVYKGGNDDYYDYEVEIKYTKKNN